MDVQNKNPKKKILIFGHYYVPDTASTGQLLKDLAEGMLDKFDVTVICVVPSYGGTIAPEYKTHKFYFEEINGVKIVRVRVPEFTKSNRISRIKNIVAYFFGALKASRKAGKQDYIFTISQPPILGGLLGDLIITVGRDLCQTLEKRFKRKIKPKYVMINNWIDETQIYPLDSKNERVIAFKKLYGLENKFVIMYSGNIGLYYDLENLLKVIEKFEPGTIAADGREVIFAFIGVGAVLDKLIAYTKQHSMTNVVFIPYQDKAELKYSLNAGDVHWVVNAKGIKGVSCPSKYYGIAACAKPVLGVLEKESEIRCIIEESGCGYVSDPGDYTAIEKNIKRFLGEADSDILHQMGQAGCDYLKKFLTKSISIEKYKKEILES